MSNQLQNKTLIDRALVALRYVSDRKDDLYALYDSVNVQGMAVTGEEIKRYNLAVAHMPSEIHITTTAPYDAKGFRAHIMTTIDEIESWESTYSSEVTQGIERLLAQEELAKSDLHSILTNGIQSGTSSVSDIATNARDAMQLVVDQFSDLSIASMRNQGKVDAAKAIHAAREMLKQPIRDDVNASVENSALITCEELNTGAPLQTWASGATVFQNSRSVMNVGVTEGQVACFDATFSSQDILTAAEKHFFTRTDGCNVVFGHSSDTALATQTQWVSGRNDSGEAMYGVVRISMPHKIRDAFDNNVVTLSPLPAAGLYEYSVDSGVSWSAVSLVADAEMSSASIAVTILPGEAFRFRNAAATVANHGAHFVSLARFEFEGLRYELRQFVDDDNLIDLVSANLPQKLRLRLARASGWGKLSERMALIRKYVVYRASVTGDSFAEGILPQNFADGVSDGAGSYVTYSAADQLFEFSFWMTMALRHPQCVLIRSTFRKFLRRVSLLSESLASDSSWLVKAIV